MEIVKHYPIAVYMTRRISFTLSLTCFVLTGVLTAQVTVTGNGSTGNNGFTVVGGTAIGGMANDDTMWSDSTDGRWKVNNHNNSQNQDLAVWPCRASVGGMVYGDALNTFNVSPEKCLSIGATGQILTANGTAPSWSYTVTLGASGNTGSLSFVGSTSGTAIITPQAAAGTPTITLGTSSGTPAVTASSPLSISTSTGNITCSTCVTSVSGTANQITATSGTTPTLAIANPFTFPGKATLAASTTTNESLNIPSGTPPTTPVSGAVFFDSKELYFNDGVANQPLPRIVRLAANSSASTSTTLANLTGISFTLAASTTYTVSCDLFYQVSATTGGLALSFSGPTSPTYVIYGGYEAKGPTNSTNNSVYSGTTFVGGLIFNVLATTATTNLSVHISGTIENGTNSGTLQLQYANAASGSYGSLNGLTATQQYDYFQGTGTNVGVGLGAVCGGNPQSGANGNCQYSTKISAAHGYH